MSRSARPVRETRGRRLRRVLKEEQEADEDFWGQDFFQEDEEDIPYLTESDQESVADSDFSDADAEATDQVEEVEEPHDEPRKRRLVPPGTSKKRRKPTPVKKAPVPEKTSHETSPVTLRQSTLQRRTAAEEERRLQQMQRTKRQIKVIERAPEMGLEDFLKEVVEVEVMNLASLNELEAFEEESKKRALQSRAKKKGPYVILRSRRVGETERTVLELSHTKQLPEWLKSKELPDPPKMQRCVITGLPAKYRDPLTKLPYATIEAFREIRRRADQWSGREIVPGTVVQSD